MHLRRQTASVIATVLVVAALEAGLIDCQLQQVGDAVGHLMGGLRGSLSSLLGGGSSSTSSSGSLRAPAAVDYTNQLMGPPMSYLHQMQNYGQYPQPGGFQQMMGPPMWPPAQSWPPTTAAQGWQPPQQQQMWWNYPSQAGQNNPSYPQSGPQNQQQGAQPSEPIPTSTITATVNEEATTPGNLSPLGG